MIADLGERREQDLATYDVCVVGSGPAGMTVARELSDCGLSICVLESGGRRPTPHGDALRKVRSEGIHIKEYSRERVLGGASTTWAGLSSPLDPVDTRPRPHVRHSGWPLSADELRPYYQRAAARYRFAPLELYGPAGFGQLEARGDLRPGWNELERKVFLAAAEPQDFGAEWRDVFDAPGVDLYLDATLVRMEGTDGRVERGLLRTSAGGTLTVAATVFVLAAGGIENARILLASRDLCPRGLGNERDQVGRYMMNHPKSYFGLVRLARPVTELPYYFGCLHRGYAGYAGLRLRDELQDERGLLNCYVRFEPLFPWSDCLGVEALVYLVKHSKSFFRGWKERRRGEVIALRDYSESGDDSDFQNERKSGLAWLRMVALVLVNLPAVTRYAYFRLRRRAAPEVRVARVRNFMEMAPDPDNRVVLGNETDANGEPLPVVRHDTGALDRRSLIELHRALAAELERNGLGRLEGRLEEARPWPVDRDASHHMGTTRMGRDPATSVVDPDCRLHSVANVYLAGASVFPTSGCANPTFTLVALAIRLAEHLRREVFARGGEHVAPAP